MVVGGVGVGWKEIDGEVDGGIGVEGGCCGVKWKEGVGGVEGGDRVG